MLLCLNRQISQEDKNWEQNIQELQKKVNFHTSPQTYSSPTVAVVHCYLSNEIGLVFESSLMKKYRQLHDKICFFPIQKEYIFLPFSIE